MMNQIPQMRFLTVALFVQTGIRIRYAAIGLIREGFAMKIFMCCFVFQPLLFSHRRCGRLAVIIGIMGDTIDLLILPSHASQVILNRLHRSQGDFFHDVDGRVGAHLGAIDAGVYIGLDQSGSEQQ
jgi:hypothetical protein